MTSLYFDIDGVLNPWASSAGRGLIIEAKKLWLMRRLPVDEFICLSSWAFAEPATVREKMPPDFHFTLATSTHAGKSGVSTGSNWIIDDQPDYYSFPQKVFVPESGGLTECDVDRLKTLLVREHICVGGS